MLSTLSLRGWIPYTNKQQEAEELLDMQELSESMSILKDLSQDMQMFVEEQGQKIEESQTHSEAAEVQVQKSVEELENTKSSSNTKLKVAITTTCSVVGAGLLSIPFIPILGGYSLVSGAVGAVCGGVLSKITY